MSSGVKFFMFKCNQAIFLVVFFLFFCCFVYIWGGSSPPRILTRHSQMKFIYVSSLYINCLSSDGVRRKHRSFSNVILELAFCRADPFNRGLLKFFFYLVFLFVCFESRLRSLRLDGAVL